MPHHSRFAFAVLLALAAPPLTARAAAVPGQGTWETTLQWRDFDGNLATAEAWYDTALDITWLANANYADTAMNWITATAWVAGLNPYDSGITGWRLPAMIDTGTYGCNYAYSGTDCGWNVDTSTSEMAHMFYVTLGNKAYWDTHGGGPQPGWGLTNTGPFSNVQSSRYWSATEYATVFAWHFNFDLGNQDFEFKSDSLYAWAVHSGDVGTIVPVPASVWLFGSGLIGLLGVSGKRRH